MNKLESNVTASDKTLLIPEPNPKGQLATQILDTFTKVFCIRRNDYDLEFECKHGCPFEDKDGTCRVKVFKNKYHPDYKDFGSMHF